MSKFTFDPPNRRQSQIGKKNTTTKTYINKEPEKFSYDNASMLEKLQHDFSRTTNTPNQKEQAADALLIYCKQNVKPLPQDLLMYIAENHYLKLLAEKKKHKAGDNSAFAKSEVLRIIKTVDRHRILTELREHMGEPNNNWQNTNYFMAKLIGVSEGEVIEWFKLYPDVMPIEYPDSGRDAQQQKGFIVTDLSRRALFAKKLYMNSQRPGASSVTAGLNKPQF